MDLSASESSRVDDDGGYRLAGARAMILDAATVGDLREMLADRLEPDQARFVMNGIGYTQGWRIADRMLPLQPTWQSEPQLGLAAVACLCGFGHARLEGSDFHGRMVILEHSLEALDYRLQHEFSVEPVCHLFAGFVRGYFSRLLDRPVLRLEYHCLARGGQQCGFSVTPLLTGIALTGDDAYHHQQVINLLPHGPD